MLVSHFSVVENMECTNILILSVDPWLLRHNRLCPICKRDVLAPPTPTPTTDTQMLKSSSSTSPSAQSQNAQNHQAQDPKTDRRPIRPGRQPSSVSIPVPTDGGPQPTQSASTASRTAHQTFWDELVEDVFLLPNLALGFAQNIADWWRENREVRPTPEDDGRGFDSSDRLVEGEEGRTELA